jgi:hypothetical protein
MAAPREAPQQDLDVISGSISDEGVQDGTSEIGYAATEAFLMVAPSPTKACTFPHCDGRMTLKIHEAREGSVDVGDRFWECDSNPEHIEKARAMPGQVTEG